MRGGAVLILLSLALAGCTSVLQGATSHTRTPTTSGASAPLEFAIQPALAQGWGYTGDPLIVASPGGALYLRHAGCETPYGGTVTIIEHHFLGLEQDKCVHPPLYRSTDDGATWTLLNDEHGRLAAEAPSTVYPPDVAVDADGIVYTIDSGCMFAHVVEGNSCDKEWLVTQRSDDDGNSWTYTGDVLPKGSHLATQAHVAAAGHGHVIYAWKHGYGNAQHPSGLGISASFDAGATQTEPFYLAEGLQLMGKPLFGLTGERAYVPYAIDIPPKASTDPLGAELLVGITDDGGVTWHQVSTGVVVKSPPGSKKCLGGTPTLAVTSSGRLAYAYSEPVLDAAGTQYLGFVLKVITSADNGATWTPPIEVSSQTHALMPWIMGGAGDRVTLTYVASDDAGDPNWEGTWDLIAAHLDLSTNDLANVVVQENIHTGGVCAGGKDGCDESLGSLFSHTLLPDGRIVIVYPADAIAEAQPFGDAIRRDKPIEFRIATQEVPPKDV